MWQIVLRHLGMPPQSAENELTLPPLLVQSVRSEEIWLGLSGTFGGSLVEPGECLALPYSASWCSTRQGRVLENILLAIKTHPSADTVLRRVEASSRQSERSRYAE